MREDLATEETVNREAGAGPAGLARSASNPLARLSARTVVGLVSSNPAAARRPRVTVWYSAVESRSVSGPLVWGRMTGMPGGTGAMCEPLSSTTP